jgi:uncharacterized protein involved in cysteine biosynthesis
MLIGKDKIRHLFCGVIIAFIIGFVLSPVLGLIAAVLAGFIKEVVYDLGFERGTFEVFDFMFTAAGALIGYVLLTVLGF